MADKILLAFCVHSHQPVGNYHEVFEKGTRECYLPFLRILREYPDIRMTLHYTGPLLEWFDAHAPEFFEILSELVDRSQVELMGGGFYEPILSVIPERDALAQIEYTSSYIQERFGVKPTGIWCTERIWDPSLPRKIRAGQDVQYTLLDDSHFLSAGLCPEEIHGHFITEREGYPLKVFPIDMHLRYLIPFKEPVETVDYLRRLRSRGVKVATYGDDGEKFGMWPGTYTWVIEEGWLRRFFDAILAAGDTVELVPLREACERTPPRGLVYLPTATYQEMMEWSLNAEQGRYYEGLVRAARQENDWDRKRAFLRGGMWDNFLSKYRESNLMHKKMLRVSALVDEHGPNPEARRFLFMGQCNCAYWHGLFGGIYVGALRHAVYENLLKAEALVDERRLEGRPWTVERMDFDLDGHEEVLVSGRGLNCVISPRFNAAMFGLEFKPAAFNISNVLSRTPEIYHKDVLETPADQHDAGSQPLSIHDIRRGGTEEMKRLLVYELYRKESFITHYLMGPASVEKILQDNLIEASATAHAPFVLVSQRDEDGILSLAFASDLAGISIEKTYHYDPAGCINVHHEISPLNESTWVILEWNVFTMGQDPPRVDGQTMENDRGVHRGRQVEVQDRDRGVVVSLESDEPWVICVVPIECVSQSEQGFEKTFQGYSVYFLQQCSRYVPDARMRVTGM